MSTAMVYDMVRRYVVGRFIEKRACVVCFLKQSTRERKRQKNYTYVSVRERKKEKHVEMGEVEMGR